jgi:hypothetical protein
MTKLGPEPLIDASASVQHSRLGRYTEVGARTSLIEVELGDYSYIVNDAIAIYTRIGKFCHPSTPSGSLGLAQLQFPGA